LDSNYINCGPGEAPSPCSNLAHSMWFAAKEAVSVSCNLDNNGYNSSE